MWLTNLQVVLSDGVLEQGAVLIEGAQIAVVREGDAPYGARSIDCRGYYAFPGIIDLHGDMVEREIEPRPGAFFPIDMAVHELDKRLAGAGVTTAYAALSIWDVDRPESVRGRDHVQRTIAVLNRLRPDLLVDHMIHARYEVSTPSSADLVAELLSSGQIHLLSLMDHTPGQGQYRDIEHYVAFISRYRGVDRDSIARETEARMRDALHSAAPNWELAQSLASMALERGLPVASHDDDTPEKVDLVVRLGATIAEFPVTMDAADEARRRGMHVVMGAPNVLRGGSHSRNLSAREAIAAGVVDTLTADYHPGALLQAVFVLAEQNILPLHEAARLVTKNPADALGLHDRGSIAVGLNADITIAEPGRTPRIRGVLRHGRTIYWDGFADIVAPPAERTPNA